jgi:hypothetical protein
MVDNNKPPYGIIFDQDNKIETINIAGNAIGEDSRACHSDIFHPSDRLA